LAAQKPGPVELKKTAGEAILRIAAVFRLEKSPHVWIRLTQISEVHIASVGEVEGAPFSSARRINCWVRALDVARPSGSLK
jgi:hypothetical protein